MAHSVLAEIPHAKRWLCVKRRQVVQTQLRQPVVPHHAPGQFINTGGNGLTEGLELCNQWGIGPLSSQLHFTLVNWTMAHHAWTKHG